MEIVEVTIAPKYVPLLDVLAAITLFTDTDEIDSVLHAVLCTRTYQTVITPAISGT